MPRAIGMASRQAAVASARLDVEGAVGHDAIAMAVPSRSGSRTLAARARARAARPCARAATGARRGTRSPANHAIAGASSVAGATRNPHSPAIAISASATARPPSEQSCTPRTTRSTTSAHTSSCSAAATSRSAAGGRPPRRPWRRGPLRPAELRRGVCRAYRRRRRRADARPAARRSSVSIRPTTPTTGRGVDVAPVRLVVEAHVATDDGYAERPARVAHAVDDFGELPHHLGMLGVAEVEAVHQCTRGRRPTQARLRAASITPRHAPVRGSSAAEARLAVGGEGERARRCPSAAAPWRRHRRGRRRC